MSVTLFNNPRFNCVESIRRPLKRYRFVRVNKYTADEKNHKTGIPTVVPVSDRKQLDYKYASNAT
jgi:hypothetical protein